MVSPYRDQTINENSFYRTFKENTTDEELVWHRDHANRRITNVRGRGWYLQMDNNLPVEIKETRTYHIPKETYHRLIRSPGAEELVLEVVENLP